MNNTDKSYIPTPSVGTPGCAGFYPSLSDNTPITYYQEPKQTPIHTEPYKSPNPICDWIAGGGHAGDHYLTIKK